MCRHELGRLDVIVRYRPEPDKQANEVLRSELDALLERAGT